MIKDDKVFIQHILDAILQIEEYVRGLDYEGFVKTRLVQDAVIRQFEIIGEATKKLSSEVKKRSPETPWKDIAGMRDKLIHQYFGVDLAALWETAVQDLPSFKKEVSRILSLLLV